MEDILGRIEMELRHAVAYVNDAVVPEARKESIAAMRAMANTLHDLADRIEGGPGQSKGPSCR